MRSAFRLAAMVFAAAVCVVGAAHAQQRPQVQPANALPHAGQAVYRSYCAACHDSPELSKSPAKSTLEAMSFQTLEFSLTQGKMQEQGAALTPETRGQLISYLTGKTERTVETWSQAMACKSARALDVKAAPAISTFGFDPRQTRTLSGKQTGLTRAALTKLDLAWPSPSRT